MLIFINLQRNIFIVGQDIDALCVKMSYVQLSLCGYAGAVIHGNSLTNERWDTWYTPTFFIFDTFQRWCRKNAIKEEKELYSASSKYCKKNDFIGKTFTKPF